MAFSFQHSRNRLVPSFARLLVPNGLRRPFEVKGKNLQLPSHRYRHWRVAYRLVTGLILEFSRNGDGPFMGKQRADCIRSSRRNYREILGDAKLSLENRHMLLDGLQV